MKLWKFIGILLSVLFLPLVSSQAATTEVKEHTITDVIVEMAEDGSYLLLGDYSINRFKTISIDYGEGNFQPGTVKDIGVGTLARAKLVEQDGSGAWRAIELTVYKGEGRSEALKGSGMTQASLPQTSEPSPPTGTQVEGAPQGPKRQDVIKLENGVFTN